MSPERTAGLHVRAVNSHNRAPQSVAALLAICCCLSAANAQWLEKTVGLSYPFGSAYAEEIYYVPGNNCVYVASEEGVLVVDAMSDARVARLDVRDAAFMAYDSHDNKVYMGSRDSLAVIDPATHRVISRLSVGTYPYRLCYNPTANKVYCLVGSSIDTLAVVDCSTDSVLASIWVGSNDYPYSGICCNPAGNKVYVSSFEEGEVAVIDGAGDSLLRTVYLGDYPVAPTYSPVSNKVYCADKEDEEVAVIDAGPDTLLKLIELDESPIALGYNPVSNKVYCGDYDGYIHVIDCNTDTILASLGPTSGDPMFFLFDSVDNRVFCFPEYYESIPAISGTGDTVVGWVQFNGDADEADPACYNPRQNLLYVTGRSYSDDVGVVDAASLQFLTGLPMSSSPNSGCYAQPLDKFYCSDENSGMVAVINCSTDSLERRIFTPASELGPPVYCSVSNKLYINAYLNNGSGLVVVDCAGDSFKTALHVETDMTPIMVYNPAMDRIYWYGMFEDTTILVVDCVGESIVARVPVGGYPTALACNPDSNRIYCTTYHGDSAFISAIDCATESIIGIVYVHAGYSSSLERACYVPSRDVVVSTAPGTDLVVTDGRARQLLQTVPLGGHASQLHLDRAANKLYCLLGGSDEIAAVDCRDMSIEARVRLAARMSDMAFDSVASRLWTTSPDFGCISLVDGRTNHFLGLLEAGQSPGDITWAPQHRRMYVVDQKGQAILVVRDTSAAGISGVSALVQKLAMPTVVRGVLFLPEAPGHKLQTASLLDATGRSVMELKPGTNDVRVLAPGVYFVRDAAGDRRSRVSVRKVIVAR